jgi:hypothetical protein
MNEDWKIEWMIQVKVQGIDRDWMKIERLNERLKDSWRIG